MPGPLTWLVLVPLLGAAAAAALDRRHERRIWSIAAAAATLTFAAGAWIWARFVPGAAGLQFEEMAPWVPRVGMAYHLGVDGLSVSLVALTALLFPLAVLTAATQVTVRVKAFVVSLLLLEAGLLGTFLAQDLILFYVFWEGMLVPMYFLIALWGGPARGAAAIKFLLYTLAGSVLMLLAIVAVYLHSSAGAPGAATFDLPALTRHGGIGGRLGAMLFLAFAAAFAIKMPVWPFHTWLPDAYAEAPPVVTVLLAAIMAKAGAYGFVRFCLPLFPEAMRAYGPLASVLAVAGILYGGAVAWAQGDLRRLLAYGSMSHMGFILLGIFALNVAAVQGSLIQMINHGVSTGALFLIAGMLLDRTGRARTDDYGGVAAITPALAAATLIVVVSSLALPGTNGFVGEFLILAGTFQVRPVYAAFATFGIVVTAAYLLAFVGRIFHGAPRSDVRSIADLRWREVAVLAPLVVVIFWVGLYPRPLLDRSEATVRSLLRGAPAAAGDVSPAARAGAAPGRSAGDVTAPGTAAIPTSLPDAEAPELPAPARVGASSVRVDVPPVRVDASPVQRMAR